VPLIQTAVCHHSLLLSASGFLPLNQPQYRIYARRIDRHENACDVWTEPLLSIGASITGTMRNFEIDFHALRRHWINHVSTEVRAEDGASGRR